MTAKRRPDSFVSAPAVQMVSENVVKAATQNALNITLRAKLRQQVDCRLNAKGFKCRVCSVRVDLMGPIEDPLPSPYDNCATVDYSRLITQPDTCGHDQGSFQWSPPNGLQLVQRSPHWLDLGQNVFG